MRNDELIDSVKDELERDPDVKSEAIAVSADDGVVRLRGTVESPDEKRKAEEQLEAKLLEGLSGTETELTPADWTAIRKEAMAKIEARKQKR